MHVADGILSVPVCLTAGGISAAAVGYSIHRLRSEHSDRVVPLTGMTASLIFAGQMLNFPLVGTAVSGHLMGGVLAASLLGPWAACLAMTLVLVVQCFLFADGGVLALGVNVLHMAVVGGIGGYACQQFFRSLLPGGNGGYLVATALASWLAVMAAAALFCLEFALSHAASGFDLGQICTLMVTLHSAIGIGEALITTSAVAFVLRHRPGLLENAETNTTIAGIRNTLVAGVTLAAAMTVFLAPMASSFPDGLEAVAEATGFASLETDGNSSVLDDYEVPTLTGRLESRPAWQWVSVAAAGLGGCLITFGLGFFIARGLRAGQLPGHAVAEK